MNDTFKKVRVGRYFWEERYYANSASKIPAITARWDCSRNFKDHVLLSYVEYKKYFPNFKLRVYNPKVKSCVPQEYIAILTNTPTKG